MQRSLFNLSNITLARPTRSCRSRGTPSVLQTAYCAGLTTQGTRDETKSCRAVRSYSEGEVGPCDVSRRLSGNEVMRADILDARHSFRAHFS